MLKYKSKNIRIHFAENHKILMQEIKVVSN